MTLNFIRQHFVQLVCHKNCIMYSSFWLCCSKARLHRNWTQIFFRHNDLNNKWRIKYQNGFSKFKPGVRPPIFSSVRLRSAKFKRKNNSCRINKNRFLRFIKVCKYHSMDYNNNKIKWDIKLWADVMEFKQYGEILTKLEWKNSLEQNKSAFSGLRILL